MRSLQKGKSKRILYFDLLNIAASFCVVAMHCNGLAHHYSNSLAWKQSMLVEVLAYWAVPVFFMLSGATLLNYREKYSTSVFIKKRVVKTLLPFFAWSMIACVYKCVIGVIDIRHLPLNEFISMLVKSRFENIYWFFIPLFAVYMSIPVLSCLIKEYEKMLWYMFAMGGITILVFPFFFRLCKIEYNQDLMFPLTGGYVLFAIEGYLLAKTELSKRVRIGIYLAGIIGAVSRYAGTIYFSEKHHETNMMFWDYLNWPAALLATAVFVFFKYHDWKFFEEKEYLRKIVSQLSSASFGVYLIHIFIIHILWDFFKSNLDRWQWRTFGVIFIYVTALMITKILQQIPVVKKIIP